MIKRIKTTNVDKQKQCDPKHILVRLTNNKRKMKRKIIKTRVERSPEIDTKYGDWYYTQECEFSKLHNSIAKIINLLKRPSKNE